MKRLLIFCFLAVIALLSFGQENNQLLEEIVEQIAEENDEE